MNKIIKTAEEHEMASERISALMDMDAASGSGLPDPLAAIGFRMEQQGLSRQDMVPHFGSHSRVSEVLNGKRPLTVAIIRRLHRDLGIPADSLIGAPA